MKKKNIQIIFILWIYFSFYNVIYIGTKNWKPFFGLNAPHKLMMCILWRYCVSKFDFRFLSCFHRISPCRLRVHSRTELSVIVYSERMNNSSTWTCELLHILSQNFSSGFSKFNSLCLRSLTSFQTFFAYKNHKKIVQDCNRRRRKCTFSKCEYAWPIG